MKCHTDQQIGQLYELLQATKKLQDEEATTGQLEDALKKEDK